MFSTLAAIGGLVSAASGVAGTAMSGAAAGKQAKMAAANMANAQAQEQFANRLASIGLQRSTAGYTDSLGNQYSYDPGSNTWQMKMGAAPEAAQRATYQAGVNRNISGMANELLANEMAMRSAGYAAPEADAARRAVANFQPRGASELTDLLGKQIIDAQNRTQSPILQGMLATAARTGTGFGQQVADYSRQQAQNVRDAITQSTIQGLKGTGEINQANLQPILAKYAGLEKGSAPNLQQIGISQQDPSKELAQQVTTRAAYAGQAPFQGMSGAVGGADAMTKATDLGTKNPGADIGSKLVGIGDTINDLFSNKKLYNTVSGWFGGSSPSGQGSFSLNSPAFDAPSMSNTGRMINGYGSLF